MKKWLKKVFEQILPTISYIKANRTLKEKIENPDCQSNSSYKANFDQISIDSFRQKSLEAFDTKNKFEDKAKTNVIGITIAITLITASSGMINTIINRFSFVWLHWTAFFILLFAILYLLSAGIVAIKVLFVENTMSVVDLIDLSSDNKDTKIKYDDCINRNISRNIIRNNLVFASYICIRNALICLIMLLILMTIPIASV